MTMDDLARIRQQLARRWTARAVLAVALVILAVSVGALSSSHEHPSDGGLDEHSCVACQVQHPTTLSASVADVEPMVALEGDTLYGESQLADSLACRLVPPLRGPPAT